MTTNFIPLAALIIMFQTATSRAQKFKTLLYTRQ